MCVQRTTEVQLLTTFDLALRLLNDHCSRKVSLLLALVHIVMVSVKLHQVITCNWNVCESKGSVLF